MGEGQVLRLLDAAAYRRRNACLRIRKSCGSGDTIHLIINNNRRWLISSGISRMEVEKFFDGSRINFLSEDNELMAEALNRGIIPLEVNKRSALLKRFNKLLDDVFGDGNRPLRLA